jgi:hypothetical protein
VTEILRVGEVLGGRATLAITTHPNQGRPMAILSVEDPDTPFPSRVGYASIGLDREGLLELKQAVIEALDDLGVVVEDASDHNT